MDKLLKLLFLSVLIGVGLGMVLGAAVGALSPGLISLFLAENAGPSPVRDGIALGLLNGGIYGFIGGVILVVATVVMKKKGAE